LLLLRCLCLCILHSFCFLGLCLLFALSTSSFTFVLCWFAVDCIVHLFSHSLCLLSALLCLSGRWSPSSSLVLYTSRTTSTK
jgi:hypothetical protein